MGGNKRLSQLHQGFALIILEKQTAHDLFIVKNNIADTMYTTVYTQAKTTYVD